MISRLVLAFLLVFAPNVAMGQKVTKDDKTQGQKKSTQV